TKECRSPKDIRNKDTQMRNVPVETSTSNALVLQCDGVGSYDWSFQADEEPTNYALMAFTSSSSSSPDNEVAHCSKACSKAYATLQSHYDKLTNDLRKSQIDVLSYKTGLESVEARIVKFEKAEKERDELKLTLENFQTSSKNLNVSVPDSLVYDRYKSGEGYHVVPPPNTGTFMPPKPDLVFHDAPTASETFLMSLMLSIVSLSLPRTCLNLIGLLPLSLKIRTFVKPVEHPTPAENLRKDTPKSRGHRHNWNRKACFVCKSLNHLIKDCDYYKKKMVQNPLRNNAMRGNYQHYARMTHPYTNRHVVPTSVLTRSRLVPLNIARLVTTVVPQTNIKHQRPAKHVVNKPHSPIKRPINPKPSPKYSNFHQKVTTVKAKQVNVAQGVKGNCV
nr:hypothetical protein [Tanacetum cinerariifolium]